MEFYNDSDLLDQHFLIDENVINTFVEKSNLSKSDIVVEVGPGKGIISEKIASSVKKLYCIELDNRLKIYLDKLCDKHKNVDIIYDNVLEVEIPNCDKLITALPYSIVEPFMYKMVRSNIVELVMITGSKYANSVLNNDITYLSLLTNSFYEAEKIMDVVPESFSPKPRVMSTMIRLVLKKDISKKDLIFQNMYKLNHKKIKNCLIEAFINSGVCETKRQAREIVNKMNLNDDILDTKFEVCSNKQLEEVYNGVESILWVG